MATQGAVLGSYSEAGSSTRRCKARQPIARIFEVSSIQKARFKCRTSYELSANCKMGVQVAKTSDP